MTTVAATRLYKSMILPLINYPNFCLTPCTEKIEMKIQRLQNKALRICFRSTRLDRTADIHARAKLSTIEKRRDVNILKRIHWRVYSPLNSDQDPITLYVVNNSGSDARSTRLHTAPTIRLPTPTSGKACKSLLYYGSKIWNDLSADLCNEPDPFAFKIAVKRLYYSIPIPNN